MFLIRRHFSKVVLFLTVLCGCPGCGSRLRVEGTVNLDGAPVDGGVILFFQGEGPGSDKGHTAIVAGKYLIEGEQAKNLTPGTYTVRINWLRKKGNPHTANADSGAAVDEMIPEQYNAKSTLTRDLALGPNKLDFNLTSK
jgi:hypothetical protein